MPRAQSAYRALRCTLTSVPGRDHVLVQFSGKALRGGWDEFAALVPMLRVDGVQPESLEEALLLMESAIQTMRRAL